ncbi:unnamed protein product, partial [Aureobasidium mustum]
HLKLQTMDYYSNDQWYDRWGPDPQPRARYYQHSHRHSGHLSTPEPQYSNLHRSHSQGHNVPHPTNIHIHNKIPVTQETTTAQRADSRPPPPMPAPMPPPPQFQQVPMMAPPPMFVHQHVPMMQSAPPPMMDPHALRAQRLGEQLLAEEFAEMRLHRHRSHSRGRSPDDRLRWDLEQQRRDAAAAEACRRHEEDTAALKAQFELDRRREEAKAADAKRLREEEATALKLKLELEAEREAAKRKKQEEDAAAERARVIDDHERKLAADAKAAADAEAAFRLKLELQAREEQERERKAYDDFLRKQRERKKRTKRPTAMPCAAKKRKKKPKKENTKPFARTKEKQEAEEKAKKEEQARIDSAMRYRLEKLGWSQHDIAIALDPEKAEKEKKKKKKHRHSGDTMFIDEDIIVVGGVCLMLLPLAVGFPQHHVPVYPRINRKFLDIETLEHYHVPWEWDRANSEYIILLRELDKYETDVLFEHTRRRRKGSLTIDKAKDSGPKFAWVRHKSKERSKSRGRDIRVTEIVRR